MNAAVGSQRHRQGGGGKGDEDSLQDGKAAEIRMNNTRLESHHDIGPEHITHHNLFCFLFFMTHNPYIVRTKAICAYLETT